MIPPCPNCGKNDFTKTRDRDKHLDPNRARACLPRNLPASVPNPALLSSSGSQSQVIKDPNARKSGESVKQWGSRLRKRLKEVIYQDCPQPQNLFQCKRLYDQLLQVDPNTYFRPATEKEKHEEQGFFDEPEIEEANLQHEPSPMVQPEIDPEAGPGPQTQAHREGKLIKSEEIVTQQTTPSDNIELQPVQELLNHKAGFLDLDIKVPWPVPFPDDEEHRAIWQNGIQTATDMFKVDGAEYVFSTWFTEAKEIDLASVILGAENEDEAMQEVFLQCLYRNYSEEEINENLKMAVDAYRASNKGSKKWLRDVEDQIESRKFEAGMTEERAQRILDTIDNHEYLIRVKFIRDDTVISDKGTKKGFKIIDKYEPIRESKKAGGKYVGGGPNVILTKKTKPGFWVGIDEKFLVREISEQSEVEGLDSNAVVYGLYRIRKPDVNRLMPMKDGALNCVAQRVVEHFDQAKRGHGLTEIRRQKINDWEKKMRIPGARVQDVAELEKILKRPITLLDITHGTIFNSKKYRSGKYEEIGMVVHNGHAFPRNQHFPRDRMVEYYKNDTWEAINNALQGPQAIWLMGVGSENQRISQFVLEDGRTFRTWKKHTEIIETCKELFEDAVDWQVRENIINEEKKLILLKSLKVVDLAEQVFGANHAGSRLANEINEWHPISGKINDVIKQACVEHGYGGRWNAPNYHINDVVCIDMKECYPASMRGQGECAPWFNRFGHPTEHLVRVAVNGELPEDDITGFAQVRSFKFASNIHSAIPVWYGKHFACRSGEGCGKEKGWVPIVLLRYLLEVGILESVTIGEAIISLTKQTKVWLPRNRDISCAIIGKFTQGGKIDEKRLTHRLVIDEGELDFLIKDCIDAGTFAGREKCPLGFILTYYEGHQPQYTHLRASMLAYAHINLLEMLRRFQPNEVVRIATDSIYVRKDALYKIENIPAFFKQVEVKSDDAEHRISDSPILCSHYPSCAMCSDPEELLISKSEYAKWIKEFLKTKRPLVKYDCKRHIPFVCRFCFGEWFYKSDSCQKQLNQPEEQEVREIQPGQWRDKGEKIYGPVADIVYWPKNRHWESIKDISDSIAPTIHDSITRYRLSYLNGGGGSGKTTRGIRVYKDISMIVFTHTNALAKDFRDKRGVRAQTWHSFFRWNGVGEWTPERMGEKKFPRVVIWDEVCTVPKHILEMFINYLLEHKCQVICCGDDAQPPPFFGEMPHNWLKERTDYYEEVLTDYRAKCPKLRELKKAMRRKNNRIQSKLFRGILPTIEKWERLEKEWTPSDRILSAHRISRRIASQKCLELHRIKYPDLPVPLIYRPRDGRKQNCLVPIPGSSEKQELVKNDIVHLPLNTLPEIFITDILKEEKILDWDLGYAMTVHTSQGMTLEAPQRVWVIDEHLAWDNLIYLAVGRVEYLSQLIRIEGPPLPPEIEEAKNKKAIERSLRPFISGKLVGYMDQDKKKGREFNLSVDYILVLKDLQKNKCELCLNEMLWAWDEAGNPDQWTVDRIDNKLGHIEGNVCLTCLECNRNHRA